MLSIEKVHIAQQVKSAQKQPLGPAMAERNAVIGWEAGGELLVEGLEAAGYAVHRAADRETFWQLCYRHLPRVVALHERFAGGRGPAMLGIMQWAANGNSPALALIGRSEGLGILQAKALEISWIDETEGASAVLQALRIPWLRAL